MSAMKKSLLIALIITFSFTTSTFAASEEYTMLKQKIDSLENSLIRNFDVKIPKDKAKISFEVYQRALKKVEFQYKEQVNVFYRVENQLKDLRKALVTKSIHESLSDNERERLVNSIDYADRIILQSRRDEIEQVYHNLKSKLSHIPKLEKLHNQLAKASKDDCPIKNLFFDKLKGILSFDVTAKSDDNEASEKKVNFVLTQGDISQGSINSEVRRNGTRDEYVTQFQSRFPSSNGIFAFTLTQDSSGELMHAAFRQMEAKTHWVEFMGMQFGEDTENRSCLCELTN